MKQSSLPLSNNNKTDLLYECENDMRRRILTDEPSTVHLASGGSRTRARICITAGQQLGLQKHDILCLASTVELLHNASLIHDDVQDEDNVRRGTEALWKRYGAARAICSGDVMISAAYGAIADLRCSAKISDILRETHEAVAETIRGQSLDLSSDLNIEPEQYEKIAAMKSGPLFRLALSLPLLVANRRDLLPKVQYVAARFAVAYQINDDLDDWLEDEKNGDLNIVNLLASRSSINEALFVAKNRAKYLLRKCQRELSNFPNDSAHIVEQLTFKLMNQVEKHY
ncbi:MAG: polyprenyl synthetase family protein [Pseudomonadota bacterium]